jgi:hypothetical protein
VDDISTRAWLLVHAACCLVHITECNVPCSGMPLLGGELATGTACVCDCGSASRVHPGVVAEDAACACACTGIEWHPVHVLHMHMHACSMCSRGAGSYGSSPHHTTMHLL